MSIKLTNQVVVSLSQILVHVSYIQRGIKMHRELLNRACFSNPNKYSIPFSFNLSTTKCRILHFHPLYNSFNDHVFLCASMWYSWPNEPCMETSPTYKIVHSTTCLWMSTKNIYFQLIHSRRRWEPWGFLCKNHGIHVLCTVLKK